MDIVIDTSAIIAVIGNEPHKQRLINLTRGAGLLAPESLHWEIGNAFSAMFKQKRITLHQAHSALLNYQKIPLRFIDIELSLALELAEKHQIYAYDAYMLACALQTKQALLSLDMRLINIAKQCHIKVIEV